MVSCKTGEGIPELKINLEKQAERIQIVVAPSWIAFQNLLKQKQKKNDFIYYNKYLQYASKCAIKKSELKPVTEFLKDTGSILYYNDSQFNLNELVILNPSWLAGIMASFVTFYNRWHKKGLIDRSHIPQILKAYKINHGTIISLLEKFGILVRLPFSDKTYTQVLVPSLLPVESKDFYTTQCMSNEDLVISRSWCHRFPKDTIEHSRVYEFSFLPLGCFDRVLAGSYFMNIKIKHLLFWRHGIFFCLQDDYSQCGLITFHHRKDMYTGKLYYTLHIKTRMLLMQFKYNGGVNQLLNESIRIIEHIIDSYYYRLSNEMRRFIPCLHCITSTNHQVYMNPFFFSYEELARKLNQNDPVVFCQGFRVPQRAVLVSYLAPDITFKSFKILDETLLGPPDSWIFLAKGGFGSVWKSNYRDNPVAIKQLIHSSSNKDKTREFQKEVQIMR